MKRLGIRITTDGGQTWETIHPNRPLDGILSWSFEDANTGLALVRAGQTGGTELVRTRDGGATWETVHTALVVGGP